MGMAEPWFARRTDPIHSFNPTNMYGGTSGGRTDNIHNLVPAGSYVMPADVVSGLGEGNSQAGAAIIDKMFSTNPHGIASPHIPHGRGVGMPAAPHVAPYASGGDTKDKIHIVTAAGETLIKPEDIVAKFGDLKRGHKVLDEFVVHMRKKIISDMKKLKGPQK